MGEFWGGDGVEGEEGEELWGREREERRKNRHGIKSCWDAARIRTQSLRRPSAKGFIKQTICIEWFGIPRPIDNLFWVMMGWKKRKERNFREGRGRRGGRTDMESIVSGCCSD